MTLVAKVRSIAYLMDCAVTGVPSWNLMPFLRV